MTVKQQCQTVGLDLQRVAHYLLENKPVKAEYYKKEAASFLKNLRQQDLPENLRKVTCNLDLQDLETGSEKGQAENFLTWGSIISLRSS